MRWIYKNLNTLNKRTGDCVIRAIASAADMTWDAVYWELAQKGYELAELPSWNTVWWEYLKDKGFERHHMADRCPDCYTVENFCEDHPNGSYILYIPYTSHEGNAGHAVAIKGGFYIDTWDSGREIPMCYWERKSEK
jgi:hypothetical protein